MIHVPAYLASPYSAVGDNLTTDDKANIRQMRYREARSATQWCLARKLWIYSPIVHCHDLAAAGKMPTDAAFWKPYNEYMIDLFKAVIVLCEPGWSKSLGVQDEITYASECGYSITYMIPFFGRMEITNDASYNFSHRAPTF